MSALMSKTEYLRFAFILKKDDMSMIAQELEALGGKVEFRVVFQGGRLMNFRKIGDIYQEIMLHPRPMKALEFLFSKGGEFINIEFTSVVRLNGQIKLTASIDDPQTLEAYERVVARIKATRVPYSPLWEYSPLPEAVVAAVIFVPLSVLLVSIYAPQSQAADLSAVATLLGMTVLAILVLTGIFALVKSSFLPAARFVAQSPAPDNRAA